MVTKRKSTAEKEAKRGKIRISKLKLNKETVMDLSLAEEKRIKGGGTAGWPTATGNCCETGLCFTLKLYNCKGA